MKASLSVGLPKAGGVLGETQRAAGQQEWECDRIISMRKGFFFPFALENLLTLDKKL